MHVGTLLTRNIAHADPCGQNIENNYVKASATPNDRVKLPNQRRSKTIGDGAERDGARRAAETADQSRERLRN